MKSAELNELISSVRNLAETIRDVRSRIASSSSTYVGNESRTRYGLIDPILEQLGWDVRDPDLVLTEHPMSGGGRADYALMRTGNPLAVVEAKSLSRALDSDVTAQTLNYIAKEQTIKYAIATNGDSWRMQVKGERVSTFDLKLTGSADYESALVLLHISRSMIEPAQPSGTVQSATTAQVPRDFQRHQIPFVASQNDSAPGPSRVQSVGQSSPLQGSIPISRLSGVNRHSRKPSSIMFADGQSHRFSSWIDILRETAKWLTSTGKLGSANATLPNPDNRKRYISSSDPEHPMRNPFRKAEQVGRDVWIEKDITAQSSIDCAKLLLVHCGVDPNSVSLTF